MKRQLSKALSMLLLVAMIATMFTVPAAAATAADVGTFTFDVTQKGVLANDKVAGTEETFGYFGTGTETAVAYFKTIGTTTWRTSNGDGTVPKRVEVAKAAGGKIEFTVTGAADVTLKLISTGGSDVNAATLLGDGSPVAATDATPSAKGGLSADKKYIWVAESGKVTVTYENLPAGTYTLQAPAVTPANFGGTTEDWTTAFGGKSLNGVDTFADANAKKKVDPNQRGIGVEGIVVDQRAGGAPVEKNTYTVTADTATHGTVSVSPTSAQKGDTITVTATPEDDTYLVKSITATGASGAKADITLTATGGTFKMLDENVTVAAVFELKPVAAEGEWLSSNDTIPGGPTVGENAGAALTEETLVTDKVDGVKFYVGAGTYKYKESMMMGNANVDIKMDAAEAGTLPASGTYFKFVAEKDGILKVIGKVGEVGTDLTKKKIFLNTNGTVEAPADWNVSDKVVDKEMIFNMKKDDVIVIFGVGTKPAVKSIAYTVMESETATWTASLETVPGNPQGEDLGTALTEETVLATLAGMKFSVGAGAYKYKESMMMGGANVDIKMDAADAGTLPASGTYFKFVAEKDGVLTVVGKVGEINDAAKKKIYLNTNGTAEAPADWNVADKVVDKEMIFNMKAGDTIVIFGVGTKPAVKSVAFTSGGVTEATAPWTEAGILATPTMTATNDGKGTITVAITGVKVGKILDGASMTTYADNVTVTMLDKDGKVAATGKSENAGANHSIKFTPAASGDYTFKAVAQREGETDLDTKLSASVTGFVLPLVAPSIRMAQNDGNATVTVFWTNVDETDGYNVYVDGVKVNTELVKTNSYTISSGLTVGTEVSITVTAVRGNEETAQSEAVKIVPSAEKQIAWGKQIWGISVDPAKKNTFTGDLNEGSVTLAATNGGGKINDDSRFDGLQFYYTIIPTDKNFTLRAKVHVDQWTYSNGQEGFGMLAQDSMPDHVEYGEGKEAGFATNQYFMGGLRMSYWYDAATGTLGADSSSGFKKIDNRLSIGTRAKVGLTKENVDLVYAQDNATLQMWAPADSGVPNSSTTFNTQGGVTGNSKVNVIGNCTNEGGPDNKTGLYAADYTTLARLVDFDLEITRNNTGYILRYYDEKGTLVGEDIKYDSYDALSQLDPDSVYVGFWVARNFTITVTDANLELRDPKDDPPPLEKPKEKVYPSFSIESAPTSQTADYNLTLYSNVAGTAVITHNNTQLEPVTLQAGQRLNVPVVLNGNGVGINRFNAVFTPDPDQFNDSKTQELANANAIEVKNFEVTYRIKWSEMVNLYVSPNGGAGGQGTKNSPIDIETAVAVVRPGQTIVLKEGTYSLRKELRANVGMNGTEEQPIRMIADPEATSRPVLDFNRAGSGVTIAADWWYLYGFNVTRGSGNGIRLTGSHNVVENVEAYANYSAGIAISRLSDKTQPTIDTWPSYNLVKNCTAWNNADAGHEDADGFTAKLTCGVGNVFDGCVAHHNADDGWDMYASSITGPIGASTLRNCIAYKNGYLFDDEGNEFVSGGNGNGLKLGGGGMPGAHVVENCYAFLNKNKGIDSNSGPDIVVKNSTSFNNGFGSTAPEYESKGWNGYNVALYTEGSGATNFTVEGLISLKTTADDNQAADNLKPGGSQALADLQSDTNFYWDGTKSVNKSGAEFTADMFKSVEFVDGTSNKVGLAGTLTRDANGVLNMGDFLQKSDSAPAGAGADKLENEPSEAPEVAEETGKPIGGSTGGGGGGGGRREEETTTPNTESKTTATKTVDRMGNVEIVVKNEAGEVIADVKVPASIPTPKDKFVDVPAGHWAEDAINAIAGLGLVNGVDAEAHIYDMNSATTRAALAKILYQLANGKEGLANEFKDVAAGQWYENPVAWAASVGVVNGFEDGTFRPNQPITREQLAVMLCRFARLIGMDTTPKAELNGFADQDKVGSWAADSLAWCVENGILKGKGADTLDPQADATRAEVAVMLQRFINLVK